MLRSLVKPRQIVSYQHDSCTYSPYTADCSRHAMINPSSPARRETAMILLLVYPLRQPSPHRCCVYLAEYGGGSRYRHYSRYVCPVENDWIILPQTTDVPRTVYAVYWLSSLDETNISVIARKHYRPLRQDLYHIFPR